MNTNIEAKIDEELYINEATLELLRRRIEADVKKGFFTSIGAPIGGAGIIAILYVLFSWIPAQLGTMIEDMPGIQRTVQESAIDYLENEQKGQRFIRQQVDLNSEKFVSKAVEDHMDSEKIARVLQTNIEEKTAAYYASEKGAKRVEDLIKSHMASTVVRQQIRDAVDKALAPVLGSLSNDIETSFSSVVFDIPQLTGMEQINKESFQHLQEFLSRPRAADIKNSDTPVILTIAIEHGPYVVHVIEDYIDLLQEVFIEQFRYIAIVDANKRFLALLPVKPFQTEIKKDASLERLLNGAKGDASSDSLRQTFGQVVGRRIRSNDVVEDVLRSTAIWESIISTDFVAVVDKSDRLVGITNRSKIIDGCLDKLSV